VLKQRIK